VKKNIAEVAGTTRDVVEPRKTCTIEECFEKSNTKVEKVKNCTWDKQLEKCSSNFHAENGNQTSPETFWDSDQLGLFGYSQKCIEHDQLSTMKHNGYCYSQMIY
ncbi:LOW QUALITY PROTEIN: hypothetical protein HID58_040663, partial [Brassica napus]